MASLFICPTLSPKARPVRVGPSQPDSMRKPAGPETDCPGTRDDSWVIHAKLTALVCVLVWIGRQFENEATAPGGNDPAHAEQVRRMQWALATDLD